MFVLWADSVILGNCSIDMIITWIAILQLDNHNICPEKVLISIRSLIKIILSKHDRSKATHQVLSGLHYKPTKNVIQLVDWVHSCYQPRIELFSSCFGSQMQITSNECHVIILSVFLHFLYLIDENCDFLLNSPLIFWVIKHSHKTKKCHIFEK